MKKLALVLALIASPIVAQENTEKMFYTVNACDRWDKVATEMAKYQEDVLFTGTIVQFHMSQQPYNGHMLFQVNQETGTWSLVSLWQDGTACVVATGKEFAPFLQKNEKTY